MSGISKNDTKAGEMAYLLFYLAIIAIKYIIGALLLIWSVNTLFSCRIPYSFKTTLAGMILIWVARLFLRGLNLPFDMGDDLEEQLLIAKKIVGFSPHKRKR